MSFCKSCAEGVRRDGSPLGELVKLQSGEAVYRSHSRIESPSTTAILYLSDIFGLDLVNNKLLSDSYAAAGFHVYTPDLFHGAPYPAIEMTRENGKVQSIGEWIKGHDANKITQFLIDEVIPWIKKTEPQIQRIACLGFCFGARIAFNLAFAAAPIDLVVVAHPSLLQLPEDLVMFRDKAKMPLCIHTCDKDPQFPETQFGVSDEIFQGYAPGYERHHWPGCTHGFAVRGDSSDIVIRSAQDGVLIKTLAFLRK